MKKVLLISLIAFIATSCFTPQLVTFNEEEFVKVYEDLNDSQDNLFLKANEWMVSIFKDAKSVVQHTDKEEGVIIGKYLMYYVPGSAGAYVSVPAVEVYAKIDVRVKEGRARLAIQPSDYAYIGESAYAYTKDRALADINVLAESFEKSVHKKVVDF